MNTLTRFRRAKLSCPILLLTFLCHATATAQRTALADDPVAAFGKMGKATWSTHAYALPQWWEASYRSFTIPSPKKRRVLLVRGRPAGSEWIPEMAVFEEGKQIGPSLKLPTSPEVIWAPDSSAFVLTWTDSGLIGGWHADVYRIEDNGLRKIDYDHAARHDFASRFPICHNVAYNCAYVKATKNVDWVNVTAIKWMEGGRCLAILAAVPNSSGYGRNMAKTLAYVVDVFSGTVKASYSQRELVRIFRNDLQTIVP